jgi:hypothetical protein
MQIMHRTPDGETPQGIFAALDGVVHALEEAEEVGVLAEQILHLGEPSARPVLDPRVGEIVRDEVKAAFTHSSMIGR